MPQTTAILIGSIFAIAATVLACIFIMPEKKREDLKKSKFLLWLHDLVNFKWLFIEKILKVLYIFSTCACILVGFFMLFGKTAYYETSTAVPGLLLMFAGPIVVRITYELLMLVIIAVNNIIQINKKMPGEVAPEDMSITDDIQ